ncbi:putative L-fucose permease [Metarhizium acridum CQMa 102]|uniref:Putative L-fucose permease n=1 Tax=Metarhizium acridum (strain CQMa 102) TaxID=655827 RepID=E9EAN2_METAQ|nr:putative L-fucose permease [Metarhizium acridum CQMa 102]EFY87032.1 putative L-fucose permease [Metarhizium acridum CQMa 102]
MSLSAVEGNASIPNRGPAVFAVTTATLILASVFVGARMICRYFIVRRVSWDDRVMILAWLIAFALSFSICYGATVGLGKHDDDISDTDLPKLRRFEYVFSILYNPALMATKTAILIFYLRLAKNTQTVLRYASWATLAVVNVAGIVLTFMNIFQCNPVAAAWKTTTDDGPTQCIPLLTEFICAAPVNIVTDLAILALPIPVLTGMRLPSRQKTILVITFTLGIFVTIVDVVRIYYLQKAITDVPTGLTSDPNSRFGGQQDFAWNASLSFMWSAVEVNIAMTCACIPTLKPLILKLLPAMLYDPEGTRVSRTTKSNSDHETPPSRYVGSAARESMVTPESATGSNPGGAKSDSSNEIPMTAMEFLTTPDMRNLSESMHPDLVATRAQTNLTASTSSVENGIYFGFVNMTKPKSMLRANASESFKYCTIVAILFFLWGISYGLLNTLNNAIAVVNKMSTAQTLGLTSAYFGVGYFFGPLLVGEWILRRDEHNRSKRHEKNEAENVGGYKVTFIVGLCIYGIGTIIFWPSAVTNSFGGFMLSSCVVGFGLSMLEVAANSFMILCGPPEYGETRLLLAQAVQGVGSVVSGLLAQKVFFTGIGQDSTSRSNSMTLINVQWTYLGITLLCVVLALFFFYMPLPEVSDSELEFAANKLPIDTTKRSICGLQLRTVSLVLAVFAQYMYVAGQESNSIYFRSLLVSILPSPPAGTDAASGITKSSSTYDPDKPPGIAISIPDYLLIGHTAFAVSRFLAGCLTYFSASNRRLPQPRTVLTGCILLCFLFALLPVVLHPPNPDLLVIPVMLFYFSEGPIWPLLFAIGLRGQGRRTKRAAAFITMGGSGPAFFPFIMYAIIEHGGSVQTAYIVVVALQVAMFTYPVFLQFSRSARLLVDPNPDVRAALEQDGDGLSTNQVMNGQQNQRPNGLFGGFCQSPKFGERRKSSPPNVQHNEGATSLNATHIT